MTSPIPFNKINTWIVRHKTELEFIGMIVDYESSINHLIENIRGYNIIELYISCKSRCKITDTLWIFLQQETILGLSLEVDIELIHIELRKLLKKIRTFKVVTPPTSTYLLGQCLYESNIRYLDINLGDATIRRDFFHQISTMPNLDTLKIENISLYWVDGFIDFINMLKITNLSIVDIRGSMFFIDQERVMSFFDAIDGKMFNRLFIAESHFSSECIQCNEFIYDWILRNPLFGTMSINSRIKLNVEKFDFIVDSEIEYIGPEIVQAGHGSNIMMEVANRNKIMWFIYDQRRWPCTLNLIDVFNLCFIQSVVQFL